MRRCKSKKTRGWEATVRRHEKKAGVWIVSLLPFEKCGKSHWVSLIPHAPNFKVPKDTSAKEIIEKATKKLSKKGIQLPVILNSDVGRLIY